MGTRSITTVRSKWPDQPKWTIHANVYRHWDGYLEGHGKWLASFLEGLTVTNGKCSKDPEKSVNGPGRLASLLVAELHKAGHEPDLIGPMGDCGQEYHYVLNVEFGVNGYKITVTVFNGPMTAFGMGGDECTNQVFSGTVEEYQAFIQSTIKAASATT